jgi:hypothetical protein
MTNRDPLSAYLAWFLEQPQAFRFDATVRVLPRGSVIPFKRLS